MSTKANKPKSPPTPSRALGDCLTDVKKLYTEYSHGKFAKSEIASTIGLSATSGPFVARLFTLKEFGLLDQDGTDYSVSDVFMTLNSTEPSDAKFRQAALNAIRGSATFNELLDDCKHKLPSVEAVAKRLETQKRFNANTAKAAASVLEKSLRFAGLVDGSNNILPVRDGATDGTGARTDQSREREREQSADGKDEDVGNDEPLAPSLLSVEIPVGEGRKVVIRYPRDLSIAEATKVGNVLNAIVG